MLEANTSLGSATDWICWPRAVQLAGGVVGGCPRVRFAYAAAFEALVTIVLVGVF
jgi:hypothetical protein